MASEPKRRPFGRTFFVLGTLYIIAVAALLVSALVGIAPPAMFAADAAWLLAGGALIALAVIVPLTLFATDGYVRAATELVRDVESQTHVELHAAHNSAMDEILHVKKSGEAMQASQRGALARLGTRLDVQAQDIGTRAFAADLEAARREAMEREQALSSLSAQQSARQEEDHSILTTLDERQRSTEAALAPINAKLDGLPDWERTRKRMQSTLNALEGTLKQLRLTQQKDRSVLERRFAKWTAPEDELRVWARRANSYTDHELMRFRHKIQHQLDQFEKREVAEINDATRHARDDAAMLAEDISKQRFDDLMAANEERMEGYRREMDEQFASFLAGQQALRTENEARMAAIGATRGVKVQANEAYTITTHAPFGRIYPVADIEGIGNKTAYALQRMGILDTEHLWHADVNELSTKLQLTPRQIRQWQSQAELMAVDGIGPQWGELLATSGVMSISHLGNLHGRELLELIQAHGFAYRNRLHKGSINVAKAEHLIELAREHRPANEVHV